VKRKNIQKICVRAQPNKLDNLPLISYFYAWNFDGLLTFCVKTHNSHCIWEGNYIIMKNSWARVGEFGGVAGRWRSKASPSGIGDHLGSIFGILGLARMRRTYFSQMARACREVLFSQFLGLEWKLNFIKIVFSALLLIGGWIYMFKECTSLLYYFHVNYV